MGGPSLWSKADGFAVLLAALHPPTVAEQTQDTDGKQPSRPRLGDGRKGNGPVAACAVVNRVARGNDQRAEVPLRLPL